MKKRNPTDATMRNVRAMKKKIAGILKRLKIVEEKVRAL